jgi:hypothetical protein
MPNTGRVSNLRVTGDAFGNAFEGDVITVYVNGVATALSCTVNGSGKCENVTESVGVTQGDELGATVTGNGPVTMSMELCLSGVGGCRRNP